MTVCIAWELSGYSSSRVVWGRLAQDGSRSSCSEDLQCMSAKCSKGLLSPCQFRVCSHDHKECLYSTYITVYRHFFFIMHNKWSMNNESIM